MLKVVKPVAVHLDMQERDKTKIADVVQIWKDLLQVTSNIIDEDKKIFKKKYAQIITPYGLLTYKFAPKYLERSCQLRKIT